MPWSRVVLRTPVPPSLTRWTPVPPVPTLISGNGVCGPTHRRTPIIGCSGSHTQSEPEPHHLEDTFQAWRTEDSVGHVWTNLEQPVNRQGVNA